MLGGSGITISWIVGAALIFYTLIPLSITFYLVQTNKISSIDLPVRKSRSNLFKLSIVSSALVFLFFFMTVSPIYQLVSMISLVFLTNALVGFGINGFWKISIHSAALATAGSIFLYFSQLNLLSALSGVQILSLIVLLLILPMMMWARYRLDVHTLAELFGGAIFGFLLTLLQLSIFIKIW